MGDEPGREGPTIVTPAEAEVVLLSKLSKRHTEYEDAIWELIRFYSETGQPDVAKSHTEHLMSLTESPERQAHYWLTLGRLAEQVGDFEAAVEHYTQASVLEPKLQEVSYFVHNNLAYSLIQLGRHSEAEPYCRMAVEIDPERHNAHKNLGLTLQAQGRHTEAAASLMNAVHANPFDGRALRHLEEMVEQIPEILETAPDLREQLSQAREADQSAARWLEERGQRMRDEAKELTPSERILIAFGRLMLNQGKKEFSVEQVRERLGSSEDVWDSDYAEAFRAMTNDREGADLSDKAELSGLLRSAGDDEFGLTEFGFETLSKIHDG